MTIVDARALSYNQMLAFAQKQPFEMNGEPVEQYDVIKIISITDHDLPKIFNDGENVITCVFSDIEPNGQLAKDFVPTSGDNFLSEEDAAKMVEFIKKAHDLPEKVLFLVNCKYGQCRSGAVVDFIATIHNHGAWKTNRRNPQIVPNQWVKYSLFREYYKSLK